MRFTLLALTACLASAMRPELSKFNSVASSQIARIGDIMSKFTKTKDLAKLKETTDAMAGILAQTGNATGHMSEADEDVLHFAILTFEDLIYGSLDDCHADDLFRLDDGIHAINQCNVDIAVRQSFKGDLGQLKKSVHFQQHELNRLQGVVDVKTEINNTRWEEFNSHMQLIAKPPACPGLPARTIPALDVYFEESLYVIWFAAQQSAYVVVRDAWVLANKNLEFAIEQYEIQRAIRDTQYCDWRTELLAACADFDRCYTEATTAYTNLVEEVTKLMDERITIKKSGDIIIHQIRFLLGEVEDQQSPPTDTAEYEIAFETAPAKGTCHLSVLDLDIWQPPVTCFDVPHYQSRPAARGLGSCANYRDELPGEPIRGGSHTVVMSLDWLASASTHTSRQWIFNIGQRTTGANHWLYYPTRPDLFIQFGAWNGPQIRDGPVNPSRTLATTYDAEKREYSLYIDGKFSSSINVKLDIQNGDMYVGEAGIQSDLQGCVRGVDVYREALTPEQVQQAVALLEGATRAV